MESMNPRDGTTFNKPAAPPRLRAFLAALRSVNASWCERLLANEQVPDEFVSLLQRDHVFGDLAVHIHCGEAIDEENVGWHTDGINSCLHLELCCCGARGGCTAS